MDIRSYNRDAWNREVEGGQNPWSQPFDSEIIAKARDGEFSILLTENIPVPRRGFRLSRVQTYYVSPLAAVNRDRSSPRRRHASLFSTTPPLN